MNGPDTLFDLWKSDVWKKYLVFEDGVLFRIRDKSLALKPDDGLEKYAMANSYFRGVRDAFEILKMERNRLIDSAKKDDER